MLRRKQRPEMINILGIHEGHFEVSWWQRFFLHILPNVYVNIASLRPLAWEENPVTKFIEAKPVTTAKRRFLSKGQKVKRFKRRIHGFTSLFMNPTMTDRGRMKVFRHHGAGSTIAKDIRATRLGVALSEQMIIVAFLSVLPRPADFAMVLVMYDRLNAMKDMLVAHLMSDKSHRNLTSIWTPVDHLWDPLRCEASLRRHPQRGQRTRRGLEPPVERHGNWAHLRSTDCRHHRDAR